MPKGRIPQRLRELEMGPTNADLEDEGPDYPLCRCGRPLCYLDRTYDTCQECGKELDEAIKLDFELKPMGGVG